jgi:hypothetical protein
MSGVLIKRYGGAPVNLREIYRYAGGSAEQADLCKAVEGCLSELADALSFSVCYRELEIKRQDGVLDLGFAKTDSKNLSDLLLECDRILLFAATIGPMPDRMLLKYGRVSPLKALVTDAVGSERVESLCELFVKERAQEYQKEGCFLTPRFSPGYGDLPLSLQSDFCAFLDTPRRLGVHVTESCLLNPQKTVTAVIGLSDRPQMARIRGCGDCSMRETCSLRKGGKRCAL